MRYRYKIGLIVTVLLMALCLMTYQSYALWIVSLHGEEENVVDVGCFKITFEEIENTEEGDDLSPEETVTHKNINLTNTYPMSDEKGLKNKPYIFKITNTCTINSKYHVTLNTPNTNTLDSEYIKFALYKSDADGGENAKPTEGKKLNEQAENKNTKDLTTDNLHFDLENLDMSYLLDSGILKNQEEVTYNLILWIDEGAGNDQMNQRFEASVNIINAATSENDISQTEEQQEVFPDVDIDNYDEEGNGLFTQDHENETAGDVILAEGFEKSELRYVGKNPNNYVWFNCDEGQTSGEDYCEKWRIIGLVNVKTTSGNVEQRVKIIRNESIGNYSWDTSANSVNLGNGINEWKQADLMKLLNPGYESNKLEDESGEEQEGNVNNSLYWDRVTSEGLCYTGQNNETYSCEFTENGMKNEMKNYIADDIIWNIGTNGTVDYTEETNSLPKHFYEYERSSNDGKKCTLETDECNDNIVRTTTWQTEDNKQALVGLMYPSDYGYAVGGGEEIRTKCIDGSVGLNIWETDYECKENDWLYEINGMFDYQWTITPVANTSNSSSVVNISNEGNASENYASNSDSVRPVVYLKSNVKVNIDNENPDEIPNGSENHPFILTMGE